MKNVRIFNATRQNIVCEKCQIADSLWTRMRGLSGRKSLRDDEGLFIIPCPSIHMFGMKFSLDVVFVTRENVVVDIRENIAPNQMYVAKNKLAEISVSPLSGNTATQIVSKSKNGKPHSALEMAVGSVARCGVQIGDTLEIRES